MNGWEHVVDGKGPVGCYGWDASHINVVFYMYCYCVFVDREDTQPSMRCVSSTSHPGPSTGCPIMPLDCWPL